MIIHGALAIRISRKDAAARTLASLPMGSRRLGVHDPGHAAHEWKLPCCHACCIMLCRLELPGEVTENHGGLASASAERVQQLWNSSHHLIDGKGLGVDDPGHAVRKRTLACCHDCCSMLGRLKFTIEVGETIAAKLQHQQRGCSSQIIRVAFQWAAEGHHHET